MNIKNTITDATQIKRKNVFIAKKIDNILVILDIEKSIIYECNDVGELLWRKTHIYRTIKELTTIIMNEYEVSYVTATKDIIDFIKKNATLFDFK